MILFTASTSFTLLNFNESFKVRYLYYVVLVYRKLFSFLLTERKNFENCFLTGNYKIKVYTCLNCVLLGQLRQKNWLVVFEKIRCTAKNDFSSLRLSRGRDVIALRTNPHATASRGTCYAGELPRWRPDERFSSLPRRGRLGISI